MALSLKDLKPCAACGGKIGVLFHIVEEEIATIDQRAVQEFAGLHTYFGGKAPGIAALFSPSFDRGVVTASDTKEKNRREGKPWPEDAPTKTRHFICQMCWVSTEKPPSSWGEHEEKDA